MSRGTRCGTLLAAAAMLAPFTAASAQRRVRELPAPTNIWVAGDTARIGLAVTGLDPNARYLNLVLRAAARVETYAIDRSGLMHQMASCYLDSGAYTIRPTLTESVRDSAAFQVGSSFGNSASRSAARRPTSAWRYASSQEQLLIMIMEEEPAIKRNCDQSGSGSVAAFGQIPPAEALNSLPPTLLRYPNSPWAAFLVQP